MGKLTPYPPSLVTHKGDEPVFEVPAGEYWIGDPCYVISEEFWGEFISSTHEFGRNLAALFPDGNHVVALNTAYGDGIYATNRDDIFDLAVDAGLIGLVPVELLPNGSNGDTLGAKISFAEPVQVFNEDGTLHFGEILVYTAPDD